MISGWRWSQVRAGASRATSRTRVTPGRRREALRRPGGGRPRHRRVAPSGRAGAAAPRTRWSRRRRPGPGTTPCRACPVAGVEAEHASGGVHADVAEDRRPVAEEVPDRAGTGEVAAPRAADRGLADARRGGDGAGRPPLRPGRGFVERAAEDAPDDVVGDRGAPGGRDVVEALDPVIEVAPPPLGRRRRGSPRPVGRPRPRRRPARSTTSWARVATPCGVCRDRAARTSVARSAGVSRRPPSATCRRYFFLTHPGGTPLNSGHS